MDDAAITKLASETAKATVKETFLALGVDMGEPLAVQKDFAFLRTARTYTGYVGKAIILAIVAGVLAMFKFGGR